MIDLVRARVRTQLSVSRIFNPAVRTRRRRAVVRRCPRAAPRSVVARARRCAVLDHGQSRARMLIRRALGARPRVHRGSARNPQRHAGAGSARPTRCRGAAHRAWRCDPSRPRPAAVRRPTRSPIRSASMSSMSLIPGPRHMETRLGVAPRKGVRCGMSPSPEAPFGEFPPLAVPAFPTEPFGSIPLPEDPLGASPPLARRLLMFPLAVCRLRERPHLLCDLPKIPLCVT